jgi:hypothetical protein
MVIIGLKPTKKEGFRLRFALIKDCIMNNKLTFFGLLIFALVGCGGEKPVTPDPVLIPEKSPIGEDVYEKAKDILYALPSPIEMTTMIKSSGGEFRRDIILDPQKANDFQTLQKQAFALGIYGADLSYSGLFEQKNDAIKLLAAAKRIAGKIGVEEAYSAEFIQRANENLGNKDSIMSILTDVYWETNSALKENNRNELAMLILGAGWVEGVYIGTELLDLEDIHDDISKRLIEQKFTAIQIQDLFNKYAENETVAESYELFAPLLDLYATLDMVTIDSALRNDEETGKTIIGGKTEMNYSRGDLEMLKKAVKEVRANLIRL